MTGVDAATGATARDDFFTLIHKGLRRELFGLTTRAGAMDWADAASVAAFAESWASLRHLLEIHAQHEDTFFLPLLSAAAPDVLERLSQGHVEQEQALDRVSAVIAEAVALAAPPPSVGLAVHRELSGFVAGYLVHLLEEETVAMPAIWAGATDEELAAARGAFLAAMPPADADLSRRAMLPALAPSERAALLAIIKAAAPPAVFESVLEDARSLLGEADYARLLADVAN